MGDEHGRPLLQMSPDSPSAQIREQGKAPNIGHGGIKERRHLVL